MPNAFDPFHKWLGIPPAEQPPHHYRLLGIAVFEGDADVIEAAADQRMAHLRSFQTGRHSAESQRLLNEVAAARRCLLNAEQKAAYDDGLRLRFDVAEALHGVVPVPVEISPRPVATATAEPLPFVAERPVRGMRKRRGLSSRSLAWLMCAAVAVPALSWIGYLVANAKAAREPRDVPPVADVPVPETVQPVGGKPEAPPPEGGRYVRIELPRVGTLSLMEVEVYSGGRNIARLGKASQINVDWDGEAALAIDGERDRIPDRPSVTHTMGDVSRPWWEVDLGATHPLDKIVVFNRTDCCQERLEGFTLSVLDEKRQTVAQKTGIPAPQSSVTFDVRIDADGNAQLEPLSGTQTPVSPDGSSLLTHNSNVDASKRFPCQIPDPNGARWSIEGDELVQSALDGVYDIVFGDPGWQDIDFAFEVMRVERADCCMPRFHYDDEGNTDICCIGAGPNTFHKIDARSEGGIQELTRAPGSIENGTWHRIELRLRGNEGECFLNGTRIMTFTCRRTRGRVGLGTWWSGFHFRNIVVKNPDGKVLLEGLPDLDAEPPPNLTPPAAKPEADVVAPAPPVPKAAGDKPRIPAAPVKDDTTAAKPAITATEIATLPKMHTMTVQRIAFHPSQPLLVSGGRDGKVLLWNVKERALQGELHRFAAINVEVWAMDFTPRGGLLAVANRDEHGSKLLFKAMDGRQVNELSYKNGIVSMAYSRDGRLLATGQDDGTIRIWDLDASRELQTMAFGEGHNIFAVAFGVHNTDRKRRWGSYPLVAGSRDGMLRTFTVALDDKTGQGTVTSRNVTFPQASEISGVQFSPKGDILGCTRQNGRISLYDPKTGESIRELAGDQPGERAANGIAFHPSRPWCITAHKENVARLWNTATGDLLCELAGHTAGVTCAQFNPSGGMAATASEDFSIKLWQINNPNAPAPAKGRKKR